MEEVFGIIVAFAMFGCFYYFTTYKPMKYLENKYWKGHPLVSILVYGLILITVVVLFILGCYVYDTYLR